MPISTLVRELQVSEKDLERLYRGVEQYLAQHAPAPARGTSIKLPSVDQLIAQAGIQTGPGPMPRRKLRFRRRSKTASVSAHLDAVADVLERYGWTQRAVCDSRGRCIRGAQLVLVQLGHTSESTADAAQQYLDRITPGGLHYWQWQDRPERSKQDVLHLVRAAADEARRAGA